MLTITQNCLEAKYTRCCYGSVQYRVREITEHDAEIYIYLKSDNEMYAFCAHTVASTQEFQIRETTDVIKKLAYNALPQENARKLILAYYWRGVATVRCSSLMDLRTLESRHEFEKSKSTS